ncbi:hypothetical protein SAMN05444050_0808 [Afipia sp. GAS231]|nr:hypothetical protein [Afipia sp. GAS231]SDN14702.1 hypothetical protein SAMN05444050_0808 [Afipia sp. GAS231]
MIVRGRHRKSIAIGDDLNSNNIALEIGRAAHWNIDATLGAFVFGGLVLVSTAFDHDLVEIDDATSCIMVQLLTTLEKRMTDLSWSISAVSSGSTPEGLVHDPLGLGFTDRRRQPSARHGSNRLVEPVVDPAGTANSKPRNRDSNESAVIRSSPTGATISAGGRFGQNQIPEKIQLRLLERFVRMAIESLDYSTPFQAEYEGSIPFTRSKSAFNDLARDFNFRPGAILTILTCRG